jgi:hypothetical protein
MPGIAKKGNQRLPRQAGILKNKNPAGKMAGI